MQSIENSYNQAKFGYLRVTTRALRVIPLTYIGQACMRVEIWGKSKLIIKLFVIVRGDI